MRGLVEIIILSVVFSACSPAPTPTPTATAIKTIVPSPTPSLEPTPTSTATPTVVPTPTIIPCNDQDSGDLSLLGYPENGIDQNISSRYISRYDDSEFDVIRRIIHGRELIVAIENGFTLKDKFGIDSWKNNQELADFIFNTWAIFWKEYSGYKYNSFSIVFRENLQYEGTSKSGFENNNPTTSWIAHELYHVWAGSIFRQENERSWFWEGAASYYGDSRQSSEGFKSMMWGRVRDYLQFVANGEDRAIGNMSMNSSDYDHYFVSLKGAIIVYLLDIELSKTGNNVGEVFKLLYENFGFGNVGQPSNWDILNLFNEVSGQDFADFFERYINGSDKLPIDLNHHFDWVCHDID